MSFLYLTITSDRSLVVISASKSSGEGHIPQFNLGQNYVNPQSFSCCFARIVAG